MQKMLLQNATAILLQNATVIKNATFITNCDSACSYNPKYSQISHHLREMDKALDVLT